MHFAGGVIHRVERRNNYLIINNMKTGGSREGHEENVNPGQQDPKNVNKPTTTVTTFTNFKGNHVVYHV